MRQLTDEEASTLMSVVVGNRDLSRVNGSHQALESLAASGFLSVVDGTPTITPGGIIALTRFRKTRANNSD